MTLEPAPPGGKINGAEVLAAARPRPPRGRLQMASVGAAFIKRGKMRADLCRVVRLTNNGQLVSQSRNLWMSAPRVSFGKSLRPARPARDAAFTSPKWRCELRLSPPSFVSGCKAS